MPECFYRVSTNRFPLKACGNDAASGGEFNPKRLKMASLKTPLIITKHVGSYIVKKDLMHKWLYKRVSLALAISGVIKKNLIDTTPLPEEKIILLHNAIDVDKFNRPFCDRPN